MVIYQNAKIISDGKILEGYEIVTENKKILEVVPQQTHESSVIDCKGAYIAPGFIDLHCHGAGGYEFIDADPDTFIKACEIHASHGTKVLYPTISACTYDTVYRALETAEKVIENCPLTVPGIHLEGPYLAPEMCGAQDTSYITPPVKEDYSRLIERFGKIIARWTYAPERDDGSFLQALNDNDIVASIGHSAAEYDTVKYASEHGCNLITHLYSCTSTITRHGGFRHLGIIETAYLLDDIYVEAIADGCHLPPELMRLIVKCKGSDKVCLITDAIRHAGMTEIPKTMSGTENVPYFIEDGVAKLADRSAFAGSIATTDVLLRRTVAAGIPLAETVKMLTEVPAKIMGLTAKGKIASGYDADFIFFDEELNVISQLC